MIYLVLIIAGLAAAAVGLRRLMKKFYKRPKSNVKELTEKIQQLQDSESRLMSILNHMTEAVVAIQSDFRIFYWNQSFRNTFSPEYQIDDQFFLTDVVRSADLTWHIQDVFDSKSTKKVTLDITTKGLRRSFEAQLVFLTVHNQEIVALVFYDLTALANMEKMKRDFIANASHQLKTPLTAIQGYAEILIDDPKIAPKTRSEFLQKIKLRSKEAAELASKLLRLSKIESETSMPSFVSVDILRVLEEVEKKFESQLRTKNIEILKELPGTHIKIQSDLQLMQLILENLFENAIKYSRADGKIFTRVVEDENQVQIEIQDQGIGIPDQDLPKIFERFFRSSNAESFSNDGVGIGMALVKSALDKLKGKIKVSSEMDKGTTMALAFPKDASPQKSKGWV